MLIMPNVTFILTKDDLIDEQVETDVIVVENNMLMTDDRILMSDSRKVISSL
jgi:hypothetical protein